MWPTKTDVFSFFPYSVKNNLTWCKPLVTQTKVQRLLDVNGYFTYVYDIEFLVKHQQNIVTGHIQAYNKCRRNEETLLFCEVIPSL